MKKTLDEQIAFSEKHTVDQIGRPLDWTVFQCDRSDIPREERNYKEQDMFFDGIYRLYSGLGNKVILCACERFKPKLKPAPTNQTELF